MEYRAKCGYLPKAVRSMLALALTLGVTPVYAGLPLGRSVSMDFKTGALSTVSIVVAACYILWLALANGSKLYLVEAIIIAEDGDDIGHFIDSLSGEYRMNKPVGRAVALENFLLLIRRKRVASGSLRVRTIGNSEQAVAADGASLAKRQAAIVRTEPPVAGRRVIVGLVYSIEMSGSLRSGELKEMEECFRFLHEHYPVEVNSLHVYYGALDPGDDGQDLLEELQSTPLLPHAAILDQV